MFKWNKLGCIFDPQIDAVGSWMKSFAQSPSVIVHEDRLRVFLCSRPAPNAQGLYVSYIGFIDLDAKNPGQVINVCKHPVLELGGFGSFDEFGTNPVSVLQVNGQLRAYYAGWTRCESVPFNAAIGCAISSDGGESFHRIGPGPVLSYSLDEPYLLGSPKIKYIGRQWYLYYVAGKKWIKGESRPEPIYKIRMATSKDGIDWEKHGSDLIESVLGEHECQASAEVLHLNNKFHMFFSFRKALGYKEFEGAYRIGYASSNNLFDWERDDRVGGISPSPEGWDSQTVSYPNIFTSFGKTYMIYQGNGMGQTGIGLAELVSEQ